MKIGVDFDDVLLDCNASLADFHNKRYGTSYAKEDVYTWHLEKLWGCTRAEAVERVRAWLQSEEHGAALPVDGALEAIEQLSKDHELHIITARPSDSRAVTERWLQKYLPSHFAGIHFTNDYEPGSGSKGKICRELGVAFLVEDSLTHAQDAAAAGTPVFLMDAPWNQETLPENVFRVRSWQDALDARIRFA